MKRKRKGGIPSTVGRCHGGRFCGNAGCTDPKHTIIQQTPAQDAALYTWHGESSGVSLGKAVFEALELPDGSVVRVSDVVHIKTQGQDEGIAQVRRFPSAKQGSTCIGLTE